MGCTGSSENTNTKKPKKQFRVLTLGVGGSGKTSYQKSMKLLYGGGFQEDEVAHYKQTLCQNLMLGMRDLVESLQGEEGKKSKVPKKLKKEANFFSESDPWAATSMSEEVVSQAKAIWADETCRATLLDNSHRKSEYTESLQHILGHIDRIAAPDWQPTNDDILHCRQRTVGTMETTVNIDKHEWIITDAGGQKTERRKWVHELEQQGQSLNAIIFFVALDDYDRKEDGGSLEALEVWDELLNSGQVQNKVAIILFLNKKDIFKEKLNRVPLKNFFKDYKGGADYDKGVEFFKQMFLKRVNDDKKRDEVFVHVTCAIDPENVKMVMTAAKEQVFLATLNELGWSG